MDLERFARVIRELRIKNNLTQKEFAEKLGVTYQAVSKWERGKNMPDIMLIRDIGNIFNVDFEYLLDGKVKKNNNFKIWLIGLIAFVVIIFIFLFIISKNSSNFEFKTITSDCDEFKITGSAAYNDKKTAIYISDVDYCGNNNDNIVYKKLSCSLYEEYRNTRTNIGSCGEVVSPMTLDEFLDGVYINVNNYVASCKMFTSSVLYMEILAVSDDSGLTTYQIPINLEDNCSK